MTAPLVLVLLLGCLSPSLGEILVLSPVTGSRVAAFDSMDADFGRSLPSPGGLRGRVVLGVPLSGCGQPLKPALSPREIVLLSRYGGCNFEDKVSAATAANYSAAIIFNRDSDRLIPMGGGPNDSLVPSVFIGQSDAQEIRARFLYPKSRVTFLLMPDDDFDVQAYLLPFAIVVGVCFLVMAGLMVFKYVQDRQRNKRHRLPRSALKKLPVVKYKEGDPWETCCICLDDYEIGDKLRVLPCDHGYHSKCIDPWLVKNKRICPQCRKKVFPSADGGSDSDTEDERAPLLQQQEQAAGNNRPPPAHARGGGTFSTSGGSVRAVDVRRAARASRAHRTANAASVANAGPTASTSAEYHGPAADHGHQHEEEGARGPQETLSNASAQDSSAQDTSTLDSSTQDSSAQDSSAEATRVVVVNEHQPLLSNEEGSNNAVDA